MSPSRESFPSPSAFHSRLFFWLAVALILLFPAAGFLWLLNPAPADAGGTGVTSLPIADYLEENDVPQIREWLDDCSVSLDLTSASALVSQSTEGDLTLTRYLVYLPAAPDQPQRSIAPSRRLFSESISIEVKSSSDSIGGGNTLLLVSHTCDRKKAPSLKLRYNGQRVDCRFLEADFPLGLTDSALPE